VSDTESAGQASSKPFQPYEAPSTTAHITVLTYCGANPCGGQADQDRLTAREASGDRARSRTSRPAAHERHRSAVRPPQPGFATQCVNTDAFQE
jgi:hypothetical protein